MLVSCIMPTRGRPAFAQRAIDCFLRQTWEEKELIVVDDLDNRSFFEGVDVPDAVSYTHLTLPTTERV